MSRNENDADVLVPYRPEGWPMWFIYVLIITIEYYFTVTVALVIFLSQQIWLNATHTNNNDSELEKKKTTPLEIAQVHRISW